MNTNLLSIALGALLVIALCAPADAQVGNDNPTGPAGIFNGNIESGGNYDPYTGNAMRQVTDINVAGAVQPLALVRTANSRDNTFNANGFGYVGSWRHNYSWLVFDSDASTNSGFSPTKYDVQFPDGREETFVTSASDIYFRSGNGTRERFIPMNANKVCYLVLSDGSRVEFQGTKQSYKDVPPGCIEPCPLVNWYYYSYSPQAIIDPYGQRTTLTYSNGRLYRVTEPAGRYLQFNWITTTWGDVVIGSVAGSDGRSVSYHYSHNTFPPGTVAYTWLDSVTYFGDPNLVAHYTYQAPNIATGGFPLLKTCIDPMYRDAMWRIGYIYATANNADGTPPVYGQILSENYFNGTSVGAAVSTLSVNGNTRTETRGDGKTRTFTYGGTYGGTTYPSNLLTKATDFKGVAALQGYDSNDYINSVTDRNSNTTNYTLEPIIGRSTQVKFPATPNDGPSTRATLNYTYGNANCADVNNRDGNNPYYVCTSTDENGKVTNYSRVGGSTVNKMRVGRIDYPDGGYETFTYTDTGDPSPSGLLKEHRLKSGGLETYTYDGSGLLLEYRDAYHLAVADPQNPSVPTSATASTAYTYYTVSPKMDRVKTVTDGRSNITTFDYNARGQVLTKTLPGAAHPITNTYSTNGDGTLVSTSDERLAVTSFTYDNYKRLLTATRPPAANGGASPPPSQTAYNPNFSNTPDYTHTDANPWLTISPMGVTTRIARDNNQRKISVTVNPGSSSDPSSDQAITSYTYDNNGNLKTIKDPNNNDSGGALVTTYWYDERNRVSDVDDRMLNDSMAPHRNSQGHTVSYSYDQAGNKLTELRANSQQVSYTYDSVNHVHQMTVPQSPNPTAITVYNYDSTGLMQNMQDPNGNTYTYKYDLMGRQKELDYPGGTTEKWTYDNAGNIGTFVNRSVKTQTFSYDGRERSTGFTWNDGATPAQSTTYDDVAHTATIKAIYPNNSPIITIVDSYDADNTLASENETSSAENKPRTVSYTWDSDLRRLRTYYPGSGAHNFINGYTPRGQFYYINDQTANITPRVVGYDHNENVTTHITGNVVNSTGISYNPMDVMKHEGFAFTVDPGGSGTRTIDYAHNAMNDRISATREWGREDYVYDLNEQTTTGPEGTYSYDANGNRTGTGFATNNLNQYTTFNGASLGYDTKGNVTSYNGLTYQYDAQNRLTKVLSGTTTIASYLYDGLGRKFSQTISGATTVNAWDGWNLIEEFNYNTTTPTSQYIYANGMICQRLGGTGGDLLYFQDGLGSTSHVTDSTGKVLESYKYDRFGNVTVYDAANNVKTGGSTNDVRHLYTGQLWMPQVGLYDYRMRVYSPTLQRFLQSDPASFGGDPTNIYRYCGNNPLKMSDPSGLYGGPGALPQLRNGGDGEPGVPSGLAFSGRGFAPGSGLMGVDTSFFPGGGGILTQVYMNHQSQTPGFLGFTAIGNPINRTARATPVLDSSGNLIIHPPAVGPGQVNYYIESAQGPTMGNASIDDLLDASERNFYYGAPSNATAAYTDTGRVPTEIAAGVTLFIFVAPETGGLVLLQQGGELLSQAGSYIYGQATKICVGAAFASVVVEENPAAQQLMQHVPEWSLTEIQLSIQLQATVQNLPIPAGK
jgi:RHS repeat-associated protein